MSANNIVLIEEREGSPRFRLSDECVECEPSRMIFAEAEDLEDAIHLANEYMKAECVEYGVSVKLLRVN